MGCATLAHPLRPPTALLIRPDPADTAPPAPGRMLLVAATAFVACLLAELVSGGEGPALLFWPATGIAFAFAWRHGPAWTIPAAVGAIAWAALTLREPALALGAGAITIAGALLPMLALQRMAAWQPVEYRVQAVGRFVAAAFGIGGPAAALLAALLTLVPDTGLAVRPVPAFLFAWLAGSLGMLMAAPVALAWIDGRRRPDLHDARGTSDWPFDPIAIAITLLLSLAAVAVAQLGEPRHAWTIQLLYVPLIVWSASRSDERAHATTLLLTALPVLATRAWLTPETPNGLSLREDGAMLVACALVVALGVQAIAADRRLALLKVARQARQDMTTGLLNDRGLLADFGDLLASAQRPHFGLVGVHLSNFDAIAELAGPIPAMQLEQSAAGLLHRQPGQRLAARLAAGRYVLVVEADTVAQVRAVAREVYAQLGSQRFPTRHGDLRVQSCVGGLLIERHTLINSEDSLAALGEALTIAASVRDPQLFVEPLSQTMLDSRRTQQSKIAHIREAVRESRLELYAQPVVDPDAPEGMISYEVLTRMRDPDGGLIQPPEFLSLAVQSQMSVALDRAVVHRAFDWLARHPEALARTHKCSINLSGATMSDAAIAEYIREQRALHGLPAERIVFEITESEAIRNPAAASRLVDDLKAQGFGIALDDFGTGLATFEYLKRFPLDYVKIDGSFIRNLTTNPIDEEIVMSTIRVARRLQLRTVAEHVHSAGVFERLRELGVGHLQGDLFGRPEPIGALFARFPEFVAEPQAPLHAVRTV